METRLIRLEDVSSVVSAQGSQRVGPERREKRIGSAVRVSQFGVNYVELEPGAVSSKRHWHEGEDELVFVLSGELTLVDENGEHVLSPGSVVGFPAGAPNAHHLRNHSSARASFLAVGTRKRGKETIHYPDDPEVGVRTIERDANGERVL
jgi:uncharacterized cupin superfamily protein